MPRRCLGSGKGEGCRGVLHPGSGQGPRSPGPEGWGRGGRCPSAHLCTYRSSPSPPQPGPRGQTVGRWAPLLCGVSVWTSGAGCRSEPAQRSAEGGQLMAWVPR